MSKPRDLATWLLYLLISESMYLDEYFKSEDHLHIRFINESMNIVVVIDERDMSIRKE
ncbi:hypothetical protein [Lederbergia galactosidilytica]|uniref:hypothetical protein n=1 Tax=Lederbergia galactosidilytica TaxID=217031 RepID=UPI000AB6E368|nr:hypothetical protein [Lederbergia galactosidilytica]